MAQTTDLHQLTADTDPVFDALMKRIIGEDWRERRTPAEQRTLAKRYNFGKLYSSGRSLTIEDVARLIVSYEKKP